MMIANKNDDKLHIVMFPWLALGHMFPYLEHAKLIASKGHRVSFISTPRNIDRLLKASRNLPRHIDFVRISLPEVENLPETAEATSDLPFDRIPYLKKASDLLHDHVARFLESTSPDWIMYDFTHYWVGDVAAELGVRRAFLAVFNAATVVFGGPARGMLEGDYRKTMEEFTVAPEWVPFKTNVAFRYYEIKKIFGAFQESNVSGVSDIYRMGASIENAEVIVVRSSYEVEPEWLKLLEGIHPQPIFPVGQLPPPPREEEEDEINEKWLSIKGWLDEQKKGSVVYIAFGSEVQPSHAELIEIAIGLEKTGLPFFWVFRNQLGNSDLDLIELPEGFESRVMGRRVVFKSWAPQHKILAHGSVGGFLTLSGWSSVVEALSMGKALILLPLLNDQGLNARVLEEQGFGYPVPRNELDGSFTSELVAESLRLVMVEEDGKVYRDKAMEMRRSFGSMEIQEGYVDRFLHHFKANRPEKN